MYSIVISQVRSSFSTINSLANADISSVRIVGSCTTHVLSCTLDTLHTTPCGTKHTSHTFLHMVHTPPYYTKQYMAALHTTPCGTKHTSHTFLHMVHTPPYYTKQYMTTLHTLWYKTHFTHISTYGTHPTILYQTVHDNTPHLVVQNTLHTHFYIWYTPHHTIPNST